jgi:uncharacterized protein (DUF4415 family)
MNNSSDPIFDRYADLDFTDAKPVAEVPALAKLQAAHGGKSRITIQVDNTTLAVFKARAEMTGGNYQTMMNEALRQHAEGLTLADVVRDAIRQELRHTRIDRTGNLHALRQVAAACHAQVEDHFLATGWSICSRKRTVGRATGSCAEPPP